MNPIGAEKIIKARIAGMCPKDPIVICFDDVRLPGYETAVFAASESAYDWRWLVNLQTYAVFPSSSDRVMPQLKAILQYAQQPVEAYILSEQRGAALFTLPTLASVDAFLRTNDKTKLKYELSPLRWGPMQTQLFERFLKEKVS